MGDRTSRGSVYTRDTSGNNSNAFGDFLIEVAKGKVPGHSIVNLAGTNDDMGLNTLENIWDQGGIYTYLTAETTLFVSSSNAADTSVDLIIDGLDGNYDRVTRTVTLNGQTQVAISGGMLRVFIMLVAGSIAPLGDVYLAETDTVTGGVPDTTSKIKAKMRQGLNITQMIMYTPPAGHTGFGVMESSYTVGKNTSVSFRAFLRPFGGVFFDFNRFDIYQQAIVFKLNGTPIAAKTDFDVRGTADNEGSTTSVFIDVLEINNDFL